MFTLLFTCLELGINSSYQLSGINKEWVFPSREGYARHLKEIDSLVKGVSKKDKPFFRMERQIPQTGNDSMKFNYRGVSQFSSVRNRKSSSLLNRLGYRSDGTNLNLRYQNNTLLMDSLLSVKYNLSQQKLNKFGFHQIKKNKQTYLYQNTYDLPLGILTNTIYKDVNLSVNTLDNQTRFLNQLSGQEYTYFKLEPSRLTSNAQLFNQQVSSKAIHSNVPTIISYQVVVPNNKQLYVSLPNIQFTNPNSKNITIRVNNHAYHYTTDNAFSFFDLGYFQKQSTVSVDFIFPNNKQITVNQPHFYSLDINSLTTAIHDIKAKKVETVVQKNKIISHYHSKTKASLLFTIPYDKGWKAKLGKKSVPIQRAQDGFIKVAVPKGEGVLTLTFIPQGFILGISISFLSLLIYLLLVKRYCEVLSIKNVVRELI